MNSKWYIGTFMVLLALLGFNREHTKVANQQIVVQFADNETSKINACDDALATITQKLLSLGVANIEVVATEATKLTIRYHSDIDAHSVGTHLSQDGQFSLTYGHIGDLPFDLPEEDLPDSLNLVISDLHQKTGNGQGLNGKFANEIRQDYPRFSSPVFGYLNDDQVVGQEISLRLKPIPEDVRALILEKTSQIIPEVRAGPELGA